MRREGSVRMWIRWCFGWRSVAWSPQVRGPSPGSHWRGSNWWWCGQRKSSYVVQCLSGELRVTAAQSYRVQWLQWSNSHPPHRMVWYWQLRHLWSTTQKNATGILKVPSHFHPRRLAAQTEKPRVLHVQNSKTIQCHTVLTSILNANMERFRKSSDLGDVSK